MNANMNTKLDLKNVPAVIGEIPKRRMQECLDVLKSTKWPLYIVGPSGSGKSIVAMNLAKKYSEAMKVPAYYVQLSQDMTKTSLILGLRLVGGNLQVVDGMVAKCMQEGGIIIVDEAPHGTQEILLMFNSIMDRTSVTAIGDKILYAKDTFRIVFCGNDSSYAGNIRLPQSFAQRVVSFYFDYPSWMDEAKIAKRIATEECTSDLEVPNSVIKYITSVVREIRTREFPLSSRNIAIATVLMNLVTRNEQLPIHDYFLKGSNVESIRRTIAKRIYNKDAFSTNELTNDTMTEFLTFVSQITIPEFKRVMLSSCMYYLDIEGVEMVAADVRNKIANSII